MPPWSSPGRNGSGGTSQEKAPLIRKASCSPERRAQGRSPRREEPANPFQWRLPEKRGARGKESRPGDLSWLGKCYAGCAGVLIALIILCALILCSGRLVSYFNASKEPEAALQRALRRVSTPAHAARQEEPTPWTRALSSRRSEDADRHPPPQHRQKLKGAAGKRPPGDLRASVPLAETRIGSFTASINVGPGPCWHSLALPEGVPGIGFAGQPLFTLSGTAATIDSRQCVVRAVAGGRDTASPLRIHFGCSLGVEVVFYISPPLGGERNQHGTSSGQHRHGDYIRLGVELWPREDSQWPHHGFKSLRLLEAEGPLLVELTGPSALPGLPLVVGKRLFVGGEHPLAFTSVTSDGEVIDAEQGEVVEGFAMYTEVHHLDSLPRPTAEKPWRFGAVLGLAPEPSQVRRAFLGYLNGERPGRLQPMVHYNSWFDFYSWQDEGFFGQDADRADVMNETSCIQRTETFGTELVKKRGVKVDSLLFDDGWDDPTTLWEFDRGRFPRGFQDVAAHAGHYGMGVGVWLSPWGGYGQSKVTRVQQGKARGFETRIDPWGEEAFDLLGPTYSSWFLETATRMRRDEGVNLFKFDGVSRAPGEMEAMLRMIGDVRSVAGARPAAQQASAGKEDKKGDSIWINLTTGTWASPFFLLWADSIWRQDGDVGPYPGQEEEDGLTARQKWIRWRVGKVQQNNAKRSSFFPLSQLMIHGVVLAGHGDALFAGLGTATDVEFAQEVWSFLGLGLQLQEMYISARRMTAATWDILAAGLAWARQNSRVLLDTHWAFGEVSKREVFCTASWSVEDGIGFVMLQNPLAKVGQAQDFALSDILELPSSQVEGVLALSVVKAIAGDEHFSGGNNLAWRLTGCLAMAEEEAKAEALMSKEARRRAWCKLQASSRTTLSLRHTEVLIFEVRLLRRHWRAEVA